MIFNLNIFQILRTATIRDSGILLVGASAATLFGFILITILARNLTISQFGLFITALTFVQLSTDLFEGGINPTVLSFLPSKVGQARKIFIAETFLMRLIITGLISVTIFIFASDVSQFIFKSQEIEELIRLSSIGVFSLLLLSWSQTLYQAKGNFLLSATIILSNNLSRVVVVLLLLLLGFFTLERAYFWMQLVPLAVLLLALVNERLRFWRAQISFKDFKKILSFALPAGVGFGLAAIYTRLDQILIFNLTNSQEAGIYGLSYRLAAVFLFASSAIYGATIPRFSFLAPLDFPTYFKKTLSVGVAFSLLAFLAIPLSTYFIPLIFGQAFSRAILPFQILIVGMIFFIFQQPFYNALLYRFKKSYLSFLLSALSLILVWFLLNSLIPAYKSLGAALAITTVYGVQLMISIVLFVIFSKKT